MHNVIIFGASGHGSVVLDCMEKEGKFNVIGFVDSFKDKGTIINGYEVLGSELDLPYLMNKFEVYGGIVAVGDNWIRKLIVDRILKIIPKFNFVNAIHPSAIVGKDVIIGYGNVFMPGSVVNANSIIHDFCIVNTNASIDHDGIMASYSSLAPNACLGGNVYIGRFSAICLGANVIGNITIGEHTLVGAGALVLTDLEDLLIAHGSPARKTRSRKIGEPYLAVPKKNEISISIKMRNML